MTKRPANWTAFLRYLKTRFPLADHILVEEGLEQIKALSEKTNQPSAKVGLELILKATNASEIQPELIRALLEILEREYGVPEKEIAEMLQEQE